MRLSNLAKVKSAVLLIWAFFGCESTSKPPETIDPHSVKWKVDSLLPPVGSATHAFVDLWGTRKDNLYAVSLTEGWSGQLWRFDGSTWREQDFPRPLEGGYFISLEAIHGNSPSSIWAVGTNTYHDFINPSNRKDSCYVIHFDGTSWKVKYRDLKGSLYTVYQASNGDVWVGGYDSLLLKFDGVSWKRIALPVPVTVTGISMTKSGQLYCTGYRYTATSQTNYVLQVDGESCSVLDVDPNVNTWGLNFGILSLIAENDELYSVGSGVFMRSNGTWRKLIGNDAGEFRTVRPFDPNKILAGNLNSTLFYLDGNNSFEIDLFPRSNIAITGIWTDGADFMVSGYAFGLGQSYYAKSW